MEFVTSVSFSLERTEQAVDEQNATPYMMDPVIQWQMYLAKQKVRMGPKNWNEAN
jgi:hypothetical protein